MSGDQRLLVLGGSRQAAEGLKALRQKGFHLVVCDMDENAPGFKYAEDRILASVYHIEKCLPAIVAYHAKKPISGVMCLACDVPHIVSVIADKLNLPGNSLETARRAVDKLAMKDKFVADGVSVPDYQLIANDEALSSLRNEWGKLVVKPVDSRGSKGVSVLDANGSTQWAYENARDNSPSGRVMAERYIEGPQVSTESIVIKGQAITPALSDRSYEFLEKYHPFIVENGGTMPSSLPEEVTVKIEALVSQAAASLGVENGIVKGDIVVHDGEPYIIELAARLSGGYFCTHQIPFSTGVYLVEAAARTALGEELNPADWCAISNQPVSTRWCLVDEGVLESFVDPAKIRALENVLAFETWAKPGDYISRPQNAAASIAMVQATGASYSEAVKNAENALLEFNPIIQKQ
ncbi:ATP-grasp domain-containing protein [Kordiimonas sp. SCSIO 12603]|uniref:ATP-grasp domain-containing protein n=1 Tax=Kordiimonas sp. SCSIO 12603 TaxID=2829596 RepID=UPI002107B963|nr:ATP-grasp domain-containing protein [Kordiimonas sp. SCSIO 12603]UTW57621.1 ATP-grasp domain-containing protein [Kordiimonas sp. SCSIO 12603]